ncbi:hypothetical protein DER71_11927 [Halanaerobium sp. DL-01]|uniref:hypothetical protein n=1 Tax=Halanaerobium sp. DL-01 TaxID=1653064 RepID=UPI000DF389DA|nr:hypothetical protein [Halanaerobium sp. DL-01]RCW82571.1 hypothetical protein DER71_11927 [Halanaerobium sp. DL-01]
METLIFILPVLLIFLFIIVNFFSIFKKIISFILKSAEENRAQNRGVMDSQQPVNSDINVTTTVDNDKTVYEYTQGNINDFSENQVDSDVSFGSADDKPISMESYSDFGSDINFDSGSENNIFRQFATYTEAEKVVLYNEIMNPPKAYENKKKFF